jgi:hypothetical protein
MKKGLLVLTGAALLALPVSLSAQGFGVAGRAGTLGLGAEAALGLSDLVVVRGGLGLFPIETDATRFWDVGDDVDATLKFPDTWYNIGVDLYLGGSFRVGGGMLYRPDDPTVSATLRSNGQIEIGGQTYTFTEVSEVVGSLSAKDSAPYVLIGFGKHTSPGIGLFLDLGVAFMGDSQVTLEAKEGSGGSDVINSPAFQQQLRQEEQNLNDDLPAWAKKYWPIASIGLRIGLG